MTHIITLVFLSEGTLRESRERAAAIEKAVSEFYQLEADFHGFESPEDILEDGVKYLGVFLTREIGRRGIKD